MNLFMKYKRSYMIIILNMKCIQKPPKIFLFILIKRVSLGNVNFDLTDHIWAKNIDLSKELCILTFELLAHFLFLVRGRMSELVAPAPEHCPGTSSDDAGKASGKDFLDSIFKLLKTIFVGKSRLIVCTLYLLGTCRKHFYILN